MTRFALIPFALFASACADNNEYNPAAEDADQEFRDMLDETEVGTDRQHSVQTETGAKVVRIAWNRYQSEVASQGCSMIGAAYGAWTDQSQTFEGAAYYNSSAMMDEWGGQLSTTSNGRGELSGTGFNAVTGLDALIMEGDWKGSYIHADVVTKKGNRIAEMVMVGDITHVDGNRGYFIGALADCD